MASPERAHQLLDLHRYDDALREFKLVLAEDPQNAEAHAGLALTYYRMPGQQNRRDALASINDALAIRADDAEFLGIRSLILGTLDREKESLAVADQAIALMPDSFSWFVRANALAGLNRWKDSEEACRIALQLDPDHHPAENLLTTVLRMQNKVEESAETSDQRLARDAEDPWAFANSGWAALQRGDRKKAEQMFRESLRLDPANEYARRGLVEAFKSRSTLYRLYMKWQFFMQRFTESQQMGIVVGIFVVYYVSQRFLSGRVPALAGIIIFAYLAFAMWTYIAPGIGHALILSDRIARQTLKRRETWDGLLVGGCLILGLGLVLFGLVAGKLFLYAGCCFAAAAVPFSRVCLNGSMPGKLVFGGVGTFTCITGISLLLGLLISNEGFANLVSGMLTLTIWSVVLVTWIANLPGLNRSIHPDEY